MRADAHPTFKAALVAALTDAALLPEEEELVEVEFGAHEDGGYWRRLTTLRTTTHGNLPSRPDRRPPEMKAVDAHRRMEAHVEKVLRSFDEGES